MPPPLATLFRAATVVRSIVLRMTETRTAAPSAFANATMPELPPEMTESLMLAVVKEATNPYANTAPDAALHGHLRKAATATGRASTSFR